MRDYDRIQEIKSPNHEIKGGRGRGRGREMNFPFFFPFNEREEVQRLNILKE